MQGEIFKESLRRGWRSALYWALGLAIFAAYVVILIPDSEGLKGYVSLMEAMPQAMLQAIGLTDINIIATPEGFLGFAFFTYGIIILSVYGVMSGLNLTANDEELGIMNMVLALPVPRWRVISERAAAQVLFTFVVASGGWIGLVLAKSINPAVATIDTGKVFQACMALVPIVLTVMGITALFGVLIRRRNIAGALAGGFVAVSYVLKSLGAAAGPGIGETLQRLSIYNYYDGTTTTLNGMDFGPFIIFLVLAAVLAAGAVSLFVRRDISA